MSPDPSPDPDAIAARLKAIVAGWRVPIEPACRDALFAAIDDAMARIAAEDAWSRVDAAEDNLRTLLGDMTQQVRIQRFDVLNALNLQSAIERLCPLWPFC